MENKERQISAEEIATVAKSGAALLRTPGMVRVPNEMVLSGQFVTLISLLDSLGSGTCILANPPDPVSTEVNSEG
jgi:hypothetical protein